MLSSACRSASSYVCPKATRSLAYSARLRSNHAEKCRASKGRRVTGTGPGCHTADAWATANGTVPIGMLHADHDFVIVDEYLRRSPEGELVVRGPQRFPGYLDPQDDRGRFVADPGTPSARRHDGTERLDGSWYYRTGDRVRIGKDGGLLYLSRMDDQIKVQGYRVELGEVEAAIRAHPRVHDAIVVAVTGSGGEVELRAAFVGQAAPDEVRNLARGRLPAYMIPRSVTRLNSLPLNANGKVDRKAIKTALLSASRSLRR